MLPELHIKMNPFKEKKFLDVLLDECLSWKKHIKYIENKV